VHRKHITRAPERPGREIPTRAVSTTSNKPPTAHPSGHPADHFWLSLPTTPHETTMIAT
jgi:hypothetical protein